MTGGLPALACSNDAIEARVPEPAPSLRTAKAKAGSSPKVYGIESGTFVIEGTTTIPVGKKSMKILRTEKHSFSDWGRREVVRSTVTTKNPLLKKDTVTHELVIFEGLLQVTIDLDKKSGEQTILRTRKGLTVDVEALKKAKGQKDAQNYLKRFKMELLPPERVVGVECQVILKRHGKRHEVIMWSHKGVLLKMQTRVRDKRSSEMRVVDEQLAQSFHPSAPVASSTFDVPRGIRLEAPLTFAERAKAASDAFKQPTTKGSKARTGTN